MIFANRYYWIGIIVKSVMNFGVLINSHFPMVSLRSLLLTSQRKCLVGRGETLGTSRLFKP